MKLITFISVICASFQLFGQIRIVPEDLRYISKWEYSEMFPSLDVGKKILFQQNCAPDIPPEFPSGTILFEKVKINAEAIAVSIEFKDTVVKTVTYFLTYNQKALLNELGYGDVKARATHRKGEWTAVEVDGFISTVIYADRKKITIIKTLTQ